MPDYDVVVVGAGPGGYVCAIRAAQLGLKTAVVEKQWLGGVCLNVGCIPSKALLHNAQVAHILREQGKEYGFAVKDLQLDYGVAVQRSRRVADRLVKGVEFLMKKNKIDVHMATARFKDAHTLVLEDEGGATSEVSADHIVIATGARAATIPGVEVDGERVVTYLEAILQDHLPKSVVIVGAGPIGLEFATIWNSYGVEVAMVEMLPRLAPNEDEEVSQEVAKAFSRRGIQIHVGATVEGIEALETGVRVKVSSEGEGTVLEAEQALVAIGWTPNTGSLELEAAGVALDDKGWVVIDERMATNVDGVWSIGDVTGELALAHVAMAMGIVCAENIAGVETVELDFEMMPKGTFSQPQIASFGMTEAQAIERGYQVTVGRFPFQANGKALAIGESAGWVKTIVDSKYGEILGAHLVGPEVTELLPELTISQMMELTPAEIARNVHIHPTLSEALMEAAHSAEGHSIHI